VECATFGTSSSPDVTKGPPEREKKQMGNCWKLGVPDVLAGGVFKEKRKKKDQRVETEGMEAGEYTGGARPFTARGRASRAGEHKIKRTGISAR